MRWALAICLVVSPLAARRQSSVGGGAAGAPLSYHGPNQLGPYRITAEGATSFQSMFSVLGHWTHRAGDVICFKSSEGREALNLEARAHQPEQVGDITLSSFPNCRGMTVHTTRALIRHWRTGARVGLGSSESAVLRAYGPPTEAARVGVVDGAIIYGTPYRPPDKGTKLYPEWIYSSAPDLRFAKFGFDQGQIVWIEIGNNE